MCGRSWLGVARVTLGIQVKLIAVLLLLARSVAYSADEPDLVARYLDYRNLTRLTEERIDLAEVVRGFCLDPKLSFGPHIKPGLHIYANDVAIEGRKAVSGPGRYPLGSLIVKEKYESKGEVPPSVITVMEKTADRSDISDWRFTMIRVSDRSVVRDGFRISCAECHSRFAKSGFVSSTTDTLVDSFDSGKVLSYIAFGSLCAVALGVVVLMKMRHRQPNKSVD